MKSCQERSVARGIAPAAVHATCYGNALAAYGASGRIAEADWLDPLPIDQRQLFDGNSVLRGQQPRIEARDPALIS